jgi:small-conductance mechanosensitive channel
VLDSLLRALGQVTEAVIDYMPRGLFVAVVLFLAYYAEQLMRVAFLALERGDLVLAKIPPDMARITFQLSRAALIIFVLVIIFPYLPGGQSDAFKGVSIFLGVLLSLGSSSAISNILAGVVLTYMRPYKIGDFVKIADQVGNVLEKGLLVTRLRTNKNVEVTIPNSAILGTQILNYSAMATGQGLILHSTVTIGYDVPWRQVHELLIEAALATEGVLPEPRPFVLQTALNDFHISYEINAHTNRPNEMMRVYSALHANIQESFNRAGVEIMSPTFLALRDGNTVTIPPAHLPQDYQPPAFRFKQQG